MTMCRVAFPRFRFLSQPFAIQSGAARLSEPTEIGCTCSLAAKANVGLCQGCRQLKCITALAVGPFQRAWKEMIRCHRLGRYRFEEPNCLLITGELGFGKSTLKRTYAEQYKRYEAEDRTVIPFSTYSCLRTRLSRT